MDERDRGTATAELAVALPAVVLAMTSVLAVGQAVIGQVSCVDGARAGARAAARGEDDARVRNLAVVAAGSSRTLVKVVRAQEITVRVTRPVHLLGLGPTLNLRSEAVAEPEQPDAGSATVLMLAAVMLAAALAVATGLLGSAVLASHRARSAADLSALAAAGRLATAGPTVACAAAQQIARSNGAALHGCVTRGALVQVWVAVPAGGGLAGLGPALAAAAAGPPAQGSR